MFAALEEELDEEGLTKESKEDLDRLNEAYDFIRSEGTHNRDLLIGIYMPISIGGGKIDQDLMDLISCIGKAPEGHPEEEMCKFIVDNGKKNGFESTEKLLKNIPEFKNGKNAISMFFLKNFDALAQSSSDSIYSLFKEFADSTYDDNIYSEIQYQHLNSFIKQTKCQKLLDQILEDGDLERYWLDCAIYNPLFPDFTDEEFVNILKKEEEETDAYEEDISAQVSSFVDKQYARGIIPKKTILFALEDNFISCDFFNDSDAFGKEDVLKFIFNSPDSNDNAKKGFFKRIPKYLDKKERERRFGNLKRVVLQSENKQSLEIMKKIISYFDWTDEEAREIIKKYPELSNEMNEAMKKKEQ